MLVKFTTDRRLESYTVVTWEMDQVPMKGDTIYHNGERYMVVSRSWRSPITVTVLVGRIGQVVEEGA